MNTRVPKPIFRPEDHDNQVAFQKNLRELGYRAAFVRNYRAGRRVAGSPELDPVLRFHLGLDGEEKKKG